MDRICPYLALADDGRTVVDGYDSEHRCNALAPPGPLERARQVQLCLTEAHTRCERFAAAHTATLAASSGLPRVAPDVDFGRTRLILEPEPAWRTLTASPRTGVGRRTILLAVVAAAIVAMLALGSAFGILGGAAAATATPSPTASPTASPSPSATPAVSATESIVAATPTVAPTPAPTPAPTQRIYIVQSGDTLNEIAARFGTTAAAIKAANGLTSDTINIGQRLIIP